MKFRQEKTVSLSELLIFPFRFVGYTYMGDQQSAFCEIKCTSFEYDFSEENQIERKEYNI